MPVIPDVNRRALAALAGAAFAGIAAHGAEPATTPDGAAQEVSVLDFMSTNEKAAWLVGPGLMDHAPAVQRADDLAHDLTRGVVKFPAGALRLAQTVRRSPRTSWIGVPGGLDATSTSGTRIYAGHDGVLVSIGALHQESVYSRNAVTRNLHFVGHLTNFPNATAMQDRLVRQRVYEDLTITSFKVGHQTITCGELYRSRMFVSGCRWGRHDSSLSDSWASNCHWGSGKSNIVAVRSTIDGGTGVFCFAGTTLTEVGCRYQVQQGGFGATFIGCQGLRLVAPIADGSDAGGILLEGCRDVDINSARLYGNAVAVAGGAQIVVRTRTTRCAIVAGRSVMTNANDIHIRFISAVRFATDGTLPPELNATTTYWVGGAVTGNQFEVFPTYDDAFAGTRKITPSSAGSGEHAVYLASDLIRISGGSSRSAGPASCFLKFEKVTSEGRLAGSASLGSITVRDHDVTQVQTPFGSFHLGAAGLKADVQTALGPTLVVNESDMTVFPELGYDVVMRTAPLANDVQTSLTPAAAQGDRIRFFRDFSASGRGAWNIRINGAVVANLPKEGASAEFIGSGGAWVRIG